MTTVQETLGVGVHVDLFVAREEGDREYEAEVNGSPVPPIEMMTDDDGVWSANLQPNDSITPAGTVWARVQSIGGVESTSYAVVPEDGGTLNWEDLLAEAPSSALVAHAALRGLGGHLPDTAEDGQVPVFNEDLGIWEAGDVEGGPGGGGVETVNGEEPDGNGNVQLSAADVGAASTGALAGEASARSIADSALDTRLDAIEAVGPLASAASVTAEAAARASADALLIPLSQKGSNSGVAELDSGGKVPSAQLPSFVDDVIEAANFAALPVTGETGKIYVTLDNGLTFRWSGSAYVEISASLALGETSTTAYRGDRGKTAFDHAGSTGNPHGTAIGDISGLQAGLDAKAPLADPTGSGVARWPAFKAHGKTGADGSGLVLGGSTLSGAPASGTHVLNELVLDETTGRLLRCITPGSPGVFVDVYGNLVTAAVADHNGDPDAHTEALAQFSTGLLTEDPSVLEDFFFIYDEFYGTNITSGQIGTHGWQTENIVNGTVVATALDVGDPGCTTLQVVNSGDTIGLVLDPFLFTHLPEFVISFRVKVNIASLVTARFGVMNTSTTSPTDGVWFASDNANWRFLNRRNAGTNNATTTDIPVDTDWHTFTMVSDGGTTLYGLIDGVLKATHTAGVPTAGSDLPNQPTSIRLGMRGVTAATRALRIGRVWGKIAYAR